ncbi:MAG: kinase [Carnobacterium sp.]|uniref:kinase n=1 Tax=Carnobacterium sp. TaxID=48221 RepID=UPI00331506DE
MDSKLIILRGNSGSGKTTTALKLQELLGEATLVVSQDVVRRDMLKVNDREDNLSIGLIKRIAEYGLGKCPVVIVEGIMANVRYKNMLLNLITTFKPNVYIYYFDIPFDETLDRHKKRTKVNEFGEKEMRSWWNEKDYLGTPNERRISKELTQEEVVQFIVNDLGK